MAGSCPPGSLHLPGSEGTRAPEKWEEPSSSFELLWRACVLEGWGKSPGPVSLAEGLRKAWWAGRRAGIAPLHLPSRHLWAVGDKTLCPAEDEWAKGERWRQDTELETFTTSGSHEGPTVLTAFKDEGEKRDRELLQSTP